MWEFKLKLRTEEENTLVHVVTDILFFLNAFSRSFCLEGKKEDEGSAASDRIGLNHFRYPFT